MTQPNTPINEMISGGLHFGKMIFIQGRIPISTDTFSINLKCSGSPNSDIALHFNPRFKENCVVRNSFENGAWKAEERHGALPFHKEQPFEIIILTQDNHFKIAVNGNHFTEFQHRIPVHKVTHLNVSEGIQVSMVKYEPSAVPHFGQVGQPQQPMYNPPQPPVGYQPPPPMGHHPQPQVSYPSPAPPPMSYPNPAPPQPMYNPAVPLTVAIPGGMTPGKMVFISGIPKNTRFTVNIQDRAAPGAEIAFHFDVRFNVSGNINEVVRNHFTHGTWGTEERQKPKFPFCPNANFDMIIMAEQQSFKVAVDNQHFIEFKSRLLPVSRFNHLNITGNIRLTQVRFQ